MARTIGIGQQDFADIRRDKLFYIDKTKFIKEWWESKDSVMLITRPRRFGKPLNSVPKWYYIREVTKMDFKYCKLEIFIPETHITQLQKALQSVDAGHIGKYDSCMSCSQLISYWRPLDGTDPYIGKAGEISCEREVKVEVTVYTEKVEETIRAIKEVHPYEEPVINALPIYKTSFL